MKLPQSETSQEHRDSDQVELEPYYLILHCNISLVSIVTDALINWIESCHRVGRQGEERLPLTILQHLCVRLAKFCLISVSWKTTIFIVAGFLMQNILRPH